MTLLPTMSMRRRILVAVALTSFLVGNCTARVLNIGDKVNGLYPPHEELSSMSYPYIVGAPKSKGKKGKSKKGKSKSSKGKGKREKGKGKWHTKAPTVKMPKGKGKGIFLPTPLVSTTPDMVPTYSPGATMKPTPESGTEPPDETEEPTTAPVPPAVPSIDVVASPYQLSYTIVQTDIPRIPEYEELTDVTANYLEVFFAGNFDVFPTISYTFSTTERTGQRFELNRPVMVQFNTTLSFAADSETVPSVSDVNAIITEAFVGQVEVYIAQLQAMINIFATTTEVSFEQIQQSQEKPTTSSSSDSYLTKTIAIAAGAGAAAALLILVVSLSRERRPTHESPTGAFVRKDHLPSVGSGGADESSYDRSTEDGREWET